MPYEMHECRGFLRINVSGVLGREHLLSARADRSTFAFPRVLVDYSAVENIQTDARTYASMVAASANRGARVAIWAPTPLTFAWNRQVMLYSNIPEQETIGVFRDLAAAQAWLLADAAGHENSAATDDERASRLRRAASG